MTPDTLRAIAEPQCPLLVPELRFYGLPDGLTLEAFRTRYAADLGAGVPYWCVAWPGGQALARFLLDHVHVVRGREVVDVGCGNGLIAAAAARAGAHCVTACDHDPHAVLAAAQTARLNGLEVETQCLPLETLDFEPGTVVCAGDLWYEAETARRATCMLRRAALAGATVLCGDPGRAYRPRSGVVARAEYDVPVSLEFEAGQRVRACVFELEGTVIRSAQPGHAQEAGDRGAPLR